MSIEAARELIRRGGSVVFFTGAGMSADSGIPIFRGAEGFWKGRRAEELATPEGFAADPDGVWDFYCFRRDSIARAEPNRGHIAIARWLERDADSTVVTQNVDGLHQRAGSPEVIELHGSIWRSRCQRCEREIDDPSVTAESVPPCECGGRLRPAVVWFGETLDPSIWQRAELALVGARVVVVVGTSAVVQPAASLVGFAHAAGATVVEVNPAPALPPDMGFTVAESAAEALPRLLGP